MAGRRTKAKSHRPDLRRTIAVTIIVFSSIGVGAVRAASGQILVEAQALSDQVVELSWMAVANADTYLVSRDGQVVSSQPGTLFDDSGLTASTTYQYAVTATSSGAVVASSPSATATTSPRLDHAAPSTPTALTVSGLSATGLTLKWSASADDGRIVGYRIYRGLSGQPAAQLAAIDTAEEATRYVATKLRSGTAYRFGVAAIDAGSNLSGIAVVDVTTPSLSDAVAPAPVSSSSVTATPFSGSRIDVIWGASSSSDVSSYQIFRNDQLVGEIASPQRRYFSDNGLAASTSYTYKIAAVDSAGNVSALTMGRAAKTLAAATVKVVRGPYIQWTTTTSVRIAWWTNLPADSAVSYGIGSLTSRVVDPTVVREHVMLIGGLQPGTAYSYRTESGAAVSGPFSFRSAPAEGTSFVFDAVGDFGGGSADETAIAGKIAAEGSDFLLTLGDNVYPDSSDPSFATTLSDFDQRFFKPYASAFRTRTAWFAGGNHEYYGDGGFWRVTWQPNNERWFSYDWGDAHVLVLDSEQALDPGSVQGAFAAADLAASQTKRWRIVVVHRPPYSSTSANSSSSTIQRDLVPLLEAQHVDLVLTGHSHNYERTYPLIGGVPTAGGVTYFVSGGGGNGLNQFTAAQPSWSAFRAARYQYLRVSVTTASLVVDAVDEGGAIFDTVSLTPRSADSTPTPTPTATATPTATSTPSATATPTATPAPTPTATATPAPTPTATATPAPTPTPSPSATTPVVFADGFESGTLAAWTSAGGLAVESSRVAGGAFAAEGNTADGNTWAKKTLSTTYVDGYFAASINVVSTSSQVNLLRLRSASDASLGYLYITKTRQLAFRNDAAGTTSLSSTVLTAGWHRVQLHATVAGSAGRIDVSIDGAVVSDLSVVMDLGSAAIGRVQIGELYAGLRTYDVVFDDVGFSTSPLP